MSAELDMKTYLPEDEPQQLENFVNTSQQEGNEEFQVVHPEIQPEAAVDDKEQNFQAFREEIKHKINELEQVKAQRDADRKEFQLQMELLKANLGQQQQPQGPKQRQMFEGMNDDDVLNVGEMKRELGVREASYQARIEELEFQQSHPDYVEVLNKYLTPLIKENPLLAEDIKANPNPAAFAYRLGSIAKSRQQVEQLAPPPVSQTAQRIVENARKPATLAQAGGQSVLSKADYYATMSDQEFMKLASKNLEGI